MEMLLPSYGVYISKRICFAKVYSNVGDFNKRNQFLTFKLLKQSYQYYKLRKAFSKLHHRLSEYILKYNIGYKTLLQQGISELVFYGDLVYKFKRIVVKPSFSDQFKQILKHYKKWNATWLSCLIINQITVYTYVFTKCTVVGQASESM